MQTQLSQGLWWASLTVWGVVNAVNVLQSAGFLSRVATGGMVVNHLLGYGIRRSAAAFPSRTSYATFWNFQLVRARV